MRQEGPWGDGVARAEEDGRGQTSQSCVDHAKNSHFVLSAVESHEKKFKPGSNTVRFLF